MILTGMIEAVPFRSSCLHQVAVPARELEDHGLFIRGPHPKFPSRVVTILAGPHSLGTAAASLAATRSVLIREIARRLESMTGLIPRERTIWAVVRGRADDEGHITPDHVDIVGTGMSERQLSANKLNARSRKNLE